MKNPRWMVCPRCLPHVSMAFTVLGEICPDRTTPELMELTNGALGQHVAISQGRGATPGRFSAARLNSLGQQLLTYIRSNRGALVDYGARYRAGRRISTTLAESAVNSLVSKWMVKNQQMRWCPLGAHLMLQVRAAMVNGNLRQRLRHKPNLPAPPLHPFFQPTPPLLRAA